MLSKLKEIVKESRENKIKEIEEWALTKIGDLKWIEEILVQAAKEGNNFAVITTSEQLDPSSNSRIGEQRLTIFTEMLERKMKEKFGKDSPRVYIRKSEISGLCSTTSAFCVVEWG